MNFPLLFSIASSAAMLGWLALIFAPRGAALLAAIQYGLVGALAVAYAALALAFFFTTSGGGFGSISQRSARCFSRMQLWWPAGFITWPSIFSSACTSPARSDALRVPRLMQAMLLLATFMFGPIGLLLFYGARAAARSEALIFGKAI